MNTPQILKGDGSFAFTAEVDGDDLVVRGAQATWFGGANDPEDDGETASGINTKKRPYIQGCALPLNYGPCAGSPIPKVPWGTKVDVTHNGKTITVPVIDLGPARDTGHAIDLTVAAFTEFAPLSEGKIVVDYRIIGAAKRVV
jgi:3D (Asp-Asp-Asp) domain-containing protein